MKRIVLTTVFLFSIITGYSQYFKEVKRAFLDGEYFLALDSYPDALEGYMKVYKVYPKNANINYRIGLCYLNIPGEKAQAIPYLEKAIKNTTNKYKEGNIKENHAPNDATFFLATAYFIQNRLDEARKYFEKYLTVLDPADTLNVRFVKQEISAVGRARNFMAHPVSYKIENLGKNINNGDANFDAIVSGDESTLIYVTSLKFYDAVYYAKNINNKWATPQNITPEIQSDGDLYPTGISFDGTTLFLTKNDRFNNDIYVSHLKNNKWIKAQKLGKNINTKYWESSATLSPDGKTLYFTSNKKDSRGGLDIYISGYDTATGTWGPPQNLGPTINTQFNEETPFLSKDGKTLYFSSQGHNSMGGFDIFYSKKQKDGKWSKPKNIGYPVNTTDDDLFFVPVTKIYGYYSTYDAKKSFGDKDIFRVEFYTDINPRPVHFSGTIQLKSMPGNYKHMIHFILQDKHTGTVIEDTQVNPSEGTYNFTRKTPKGDYHMILEADGYKKTIKDITIPGDYSLNQLKKDIVIQPLAEEVSYLPVVFFGYDKFSLATIEKNKVNRLIDLLKNNPGLIINITGYTDARGPSWYNRRLSLKRARTIAELLKKNGILSKQYQVKGAGETNFIAINQYSDGRDCPEGRAFNRRVAVTIVQSPVESIKPETVEIPANLKIK